MGCALLPQGSFPWVLQVLVPSSLCARANQDVLAPIAAQWEEVVRASQKREVGGSEGRYVTSGRVTISLSLYLGRKIPPSFSWFAVMCGKVDHHLSQQVRKSLLYF